LGNGMLDEVFALLRIDDDRPEFYLKLALLYIPASVVIFACMGAYSRRNVLQGSLLLSADLSRRRGSRRCWPSSPPTSPTAITPWRAAGLLLAWLISTLGVSLGRLAGRRVLRVCHHRGLLVQPAIIAGIGHDAQILEWHLDRARSEGVRVIGYVDATAPIGQKVPGGLRILGRIDDLPDLIRAHHVGQVLISTSDLTHDEALQVLQRVLPTPAELSLAPDLFRMLTTGGHLPPPGRRYLARGR